MRATKKFVVAIPKDDGGFTMYSMKEWLRDHPEEVPPGRDPNTSNSWTLRDGLKRAGWAVRETDAQVILVKPDRGSTGALEEVFGAPGDDEEEVEASEIAFSLEYQLRDFIAQNIGNMKVAERRLRLFTDGTGRDGVEYSTPVGFIDILAVDDTGTFFVFELKRASSPDHAIGQIARYMGWIKQNMAGGKEVYGIIVAKEIGEKLRYAVSVFPNVSLFEYEVEFHLKPAHELLHDRA